MKHDRFIELLNLYLDGEISQAESADLEREITQNPERRKIYRQYCQMQRACNMLAEKFRDAAEAPQAAGDNVIAFPSRPAAHWARTVSLVASGAVAACFVFIVARSGFSPSAARPVSTPAAQTLAAQPMPVLREQSIPVTSIVPNESLSYQRPVFVSSANPGDFAAAAGAPLVMQPGRRKSLFLSVPPLPESQMRQSITIPVDFPRNVQPLEIQPVLENAIQFQR